MGQNGKERGREKGNCNQKERDSGGLPGWRMGLSGPVCAPEPGRATHVANSSSVTESPTHLQSDKEVYEHRHHSAAVHSSGVVGGD